MDVSHDITISMGGVDNEGDKEEGMVEIVDVEGRECD